MASSWQPKRSRSQSCMTNKASTKLKWSRRTLVWSTVEWAQITGILSAYKTIFSTCQLIINMFTARQWSFGRVCVCVHWVGSTMWPIPMMHWTLQGTPPPLPSPAAPRTWALTVQPAPHMGPYYTGTLPHTQACTFGRRAVRILLHCFLIYYKYTCFSLVFFAPVLNVHNMWLD